MAASAAHTKAAHLAPAQRQQQRHPPLAAPARRPRTAGSAPPPRASLLGSLFDTAAAANAEALARKEGKELVGKARGVSPLTAVPRSLLDVPGKADACASVLSRQGCLGVQGVLSAATAAELLAFIREENARCQEEVNAGRVEFDSRFGGVNCR
jgi:hypothetical protein